MNKNSVPPTPLLNNSCGLSPEEIRGLLERMLLIRYAETRIAQRVQEKRFEHRVICILAKKQTLSAFVLCCGIQTMYSARTALMVTSWQRAALWKNCLVKCIAENLVLQADVGDRCIFATRHMVCWALLRL